MATKPVVVDLGCGPNKVPGAVGIDVRAMAGMNVVGDVEQTLPFRTNSVDVVWLRHVMEHVRNLIGLMEEIYRVSRPGGAVEVVVPIIRRVEPSAIPPTSAILRKIPFNILSFQPITEYGPISRSRRSPMMYENPSDGCPHTSRNDVGAISGMWSITCLSRFEL